MADGSKYSLTVMCLGLHGNMTSIVHTLMSHPAYLAYSTDSGRQVMEFQGNAEEIAYVLSIVGFSGLMAVSEQCLIDCLTVTYDAPETLQDGTGNMNSERPRLRDA